MMLVKIAARNLFRNRRRSVTTLGTITIGAHAPAHEFARARMVDKRRMIDDTHAAVFDRRELREDVFDGLRSRLLLDCFPLFREARDFAFVMKISASRCEYQTSSARMRAYSSMCSRYDATMVRTAPVQRRPPRPSSRDASSMLAAKRLTSHSHGARRVSSKSLMSNNSRRSGLANPPKFAA